MANKNAKPKWLESPCDYCPRNDDHCQSCGFYAEWFPRSWNRLCGILRNNWGMNTEAAAPVVYFDTDSIAITGGPRNAL